MIENPITCQVNPYSSQADRLFLQTCSKPPRGEQTRNVLRFGPGFLSLDHFGERKGEKEREGIYCRIVDGRGPKGQADLEGSTMGHKRPH